MREIKFRVWDTINKKFLLPHRDYQIYNLTINTIEFRSDDRYVYQQFTGLKDKNGKEIYEGDIAKDLDGEIGEFQFNNGSFIFKSEIVIPFWSVLELNGVVYPRAIKPDAFEIIGNICENSKLLNK